MNEEQFAELMEQLRIMADLFSDTLTAVEAIGRDAEDMADRIAMLAARREGDVIEIPPWLNRGAECYRSPQSPANARIRVSGNGLCRKPGE